MHESKTRKFSWHELTCIFGGYIHTQITGISLISNMQIRTFIFPEIAANKELPSPRENIVLLHIRDDSWIGLKMSVPENI